MAAAPTYHTGQDQAIAARRVSIVFPRKKYTITDMELYTLTYAGHHAFA